MHSGSPQAVSIPPEPCGEEDVFVVCGVMPLGEQLCLPLLAADLQFTGLP